MFRLAKQLSRQGVLGVNERNANYLLPYNKRTLYPLVDDKLKTKLLAKEAKIAVPELYGVVETYRAVREVKELVSSYQDFVVKPACGSGGKGVLVISKVRRDSAGKEKYQTGAGVYISEEELQYHFINILSGMYSLGGRLDRALIEYRVIPEQLFPEVSGEGVPDVRIVVFLGVPVMAMLRLPTRLSDGKANLHQGAIGVGINLSRGITMNAVSKTAIISEHPDTGVHVSGVTIPHWRELLMLASRCYELTKLGYQGVDIVLDKHKGPLILEVNARPGLNIQIANAVGLKGRLEQVKSEFRMHSPEERVNFAVAAFQ